MSNALGYHRVSGNSQIEGDGFPRQHDAVERFAAAFNLTIVQHFDESAVPGATEHMDRPAFSAMLAFMDDHDINTIVVERMDRLARDLMVSELLLKACRERGIMVFCADQGAMIDMASNDVDPTRKLIRQVMGAVSEWEKSNLVRKLRAARERTGRFGGRAKYGQKPGEAAVVTSIMTMRAEGRSFRDIASSLNELNVLSRDAKQWHKQMVINIVRDQEASKLNP
jgi:DNA invertase Pin-like site-specific DNA recombinase